MKLELNYQSTNISFEVIFRKRKTIQIVIDPPDKITVTAPTIMTKEQVLKFVESKGNWIIKKLKYLETLDYSNINKEFVDGELFLYLGKEYSLQIIEDPKIMFSEVKLIDDKLILKVRNNNSQEIRSILELWYKSKADEVIRSRVIYYQKYFDKEPSRIKIKEQKRRWGSCTYKDELFFNWRCVMADLEALDYVVVHEMCHMVQKNHSKEYWKVVASVMPDYKVQKKYLKENGIRMKF